MAEEYSIQEIVRWLSRHDAALASLRFVRVEDYEADKRIEESTHLNLNHRADENKAELDKLKFRYYVILGTIGSGLGLAQLLKVVGL